MREDWSDAAIVRLREAWDLGLSTAEIGRAMGMSKNAIVGKAHRLNLPSRPSPIRRDGAPPLPPRARPIGRAPTLAPLVAVIEPPRPDRIAAKPAVAPSFPTVRTRPVGPCCWPIGDVGVRGFHYCEVAANHRSGYCAEHVKLAFTRPQLTQAAQKRLARLA